jgi:hypothetical protein
MTPDVPQTFVHTPEYALVLAILHQAYVANLAIITVTPVRK